MQEFVARSGAWLWTSYGIFSILAAVFLPIFCGVWIIRKALHWHQPRLSSVLQVAFFHPYCNAGGGGERVLWVAILALTHKYPNAALSVYTGDPETSENILAKARDRFQLRLPSTIRFVRLRSRRLLEASCYPVCTLLGQSLGSVLVGLEALWRLVPDVYIDSMGYAFTLPLFRLLGGCRVGAYVHYPTISSDMLHVVASGQPTFNNSGLVAHSRPLRTLKLAYYRAFALAYRLVGAAAHVVMVNGSWTRGHIADIWRRPHVTRLVFPPVDVRRMRAVAPTAPRRRWLLSVAQFRPEKDHALQLHTLAVLLREYPEAAEGVRLVLAGSCRDHQDDGRVLQLRRTAETLGIADRLDMQVNVPLQQLLDLFGQALIGLHTMKNEHFGIGVVEMMAAGLLVVAHDSGGPRADIVDTTEQGRTGYLATTAHQYARAVRDILALDEHEREQIRVRARASCDRFSEGLFEEGFVNACHDLLGPPPQQQHQQQQDADIVAS